MADIQEISEIMDPVDFYSTVTSEIFAESYLSYNPGQRQHLGKILLKCLRRHPHDAIIQIDASNNEQESVGSVLERSINLANAMRNFGVRTGDVVALMGRSHLDVCIPFYASFFLGAAFMGLDNNLKINELKAMLNIGKPKLLYCEVENLEIVQKLKEEIDTEVIAFAHNEHFISFAEFIQKYKTDEPNSTFRVAEYDPEQTAALIACTSGSSGLPKAAEITHANLAPHMHLFYTSKQGDFRTQSRLVLSLAAIHQVTAARLLLQSAVFCIRRLHTSAPISTGHLVEIFKKYKPSWTGMNPAMAANLLKTPEALDWTTFETFGLWGGTVPDGLMSRLNKLIGKKATFNGYGLTETSGLVFLSYDDQNSFDAPLPHYQVKLVDAETSKEVVENGAGELWLKGPFIFKNYYNDAESTKEAISADGWFKTGDLFRRDNAQFFHVGRLGTNFKYKDCHVSSQEIESLLLQLEGVSEVVVEGVPHQDGELPLAIIVTKPQHNLTIAQAMDYVKENLSDGKQLRGGVIFADSLPRTSSGKLDRKQLQLQAVEHYSSQDDGVQSGIQKISYTTVPRKSGFCCC